MNPRCLLRASAFSLALGVVSATAQALVLSPTAHVVGFNSYTDVGGVAGVGADVVFWMDAATPGCDGFWLTPNDPGFKQTYALLLMLKATGGQVSVYAYDNNYWTGSTGHFCKVRSLTPQ